VSDIHFKVTPDPNKLARELKGDAEGAISAGMAHVLAAIEAESVEETPVKEGDLVDSITNYLTDGGRTGILKATARHAGWVHEGTGIYGPHKQPIRPKSGKALKFTIGGGGEIPRRGKGKKAGAVFF